MGACECWECADGAFTLVVNFSTCTSCRPCIFSKLSVYSSSRPSSSGCPGTFCELQFVPHGQKSVPCEILRSF